MRQQTRQCWILAGVLWFGFCGLAARSQIVLKPNGREAIPLRVKAMKADVTIEKQFASTKLVLTFQNETSDRIEADFIYTLPPDTLVTSFAYWYSSERVPAKIMEKEEAAAIYRHITTRMHDPALIELVGKRTFRARIFPVMPNDDLRVEMTFAQTLTGDSKGALFTFPLQTKKGNALDSVNVRVHVKGDDQLDGVTNANGLPVKRNQNGYELVLKGTNFRPQQDLRVRLVRKPKPLRALLYAAPADRSDGYFALALIPNQIILHPKLTLRGVPTQEIVPGLPARIAAGETVRVFGRYRGSGRGFVTLSGQSDGKPISLSQPVTFGKTAVPGNLASKLWAARRMEELSANNRNRALVILLSQKFGLPGKYTSWLAVPKEEMQRYESEIAEAKIELLAKRLYAEIQRGRANGATARNLKAKIGDWAKKLGQPLDYALKNAWSHIISGLANRIAEEAASGRQHSAAARQAQSELRTLTKMIGGDVKQILAQNLIADIEDAAGRLAIEIRNRRANSHAAQRLRVRYQLLCKLTGSDPRTYLGYEFANEMSQLAQEIVAERHKARPDTRLLARRTKELRQIAQTTGLSPQRDLADAEQNWNNAERQRLVEEVVTERHKTQPDAQRIAGMMRELHKLHSLTKSPGGSLQSELASAEGNWRYSEREKTRNKLVEERNKSNPNADTVKALENNMLALYDKSESDQGRTRIERIKIHAEQAKLKNEIEAAPNFTELTALKERQAELEQRENELRARMGDPLIRVEAPADAQQVIAILPGGEIKRLDYVAAAHSWQARFDIPTYASQGEYVITVIVVLRDGTRRTQIIRYHVDTTPPTGTGHAQLADHAPDQTQPAISGSHSSLIAHHASLRLELDGGNDTARVRALLPWGATVELKPSPGSHCFFALVPVPTKQTHWADRVRYILTDRAHNRTVVTVDMEQ